MYYNTIDILRITVVNCTHTYNIPIYVIYKYININKDT